MQKPRRLGIKNPTKNDRTGEGNRSDRTVIPNVVLHMLELGMISPSDFIVYFSYLRLAQDTLECWTGTRSIAKISGLSTPTITKSKKVLSQRFDILGGKSLLQIQSGDGRKAKSDTITITDIWKENNLLWNPK